MIANILQVFFYIFVLLTMAGDSIFGAFQMPTPDFVKALGENKLLYTLGGFFMFA